MFLYIKTNILRGYGIFKNDFAHPREPAKEACTPAETSKLLTSRTMSTRVSAVATIGPGWRGAALLPVRELALLGFRPTLDWLNFGFFQQ